VVFGILLFVLAKTAWPAILKAVEEREAKIQAQLDAAAKANAEAQRLLAVYQQQIAAAREEAQAIVAAARQAGDRVREDLVAKGRSEQEELLVRARREIGLEKDKALVELRQEAVELSIAAASKVLERNLDSEADRRLVQDYLDRLGTPGA
jgi:F-type H+-transporting ATPase subunit b